MTPLFGMAVPALILSCLAGCSLLLAAKAPPQVRFWIAMTGLIAWLVPWPLMSRATRLAESTVSIPFIETPANAVANLTKGIADRMIAHDGGVNGILHGLPDYWIIGLFLPGLLWFGYDCMSYRRTILGWRQCSRPDESLRQLLPLRLRNLKTSILVVQNSKVAAATGILQPALWIGDQYTGGEGLQAALTHECCHIRRRDPLRLTLIALIRRAYFWNPFVAFFARQAGFLIEASCDHDCATLLGKEHYRTELAQLILRFHEAPELPRLVPTALIQSHNLRRVRLLEIEHRAGIKMYGALSLCVLGLLLTATLAVHSQNSPGALNANEDSGELKVVVVRRNSILGDAIVWRTPGQPPTLDESTEVLKLWESIGDHLLVKKDMKLYYVNDPATVKQAVELLREANEQSAPRRQRVNELANAATPPEIQEKLRELAKQTNVIWQKLQPVPGGFGNPDDALFAELDNLSQQSQAIQREQEQKVLQQHPDWKAEGDKASAATSLKLRSMASEAIEKGLGHPKP